MPLHRNPPTKAVSLLISKQSFICPTCAFAQAFVCTSTAQIQSKSQSRRIGSLGKPRNVQYASSVASSTAVNASKNVPPRLTNLHDSLGRLRKDAATFVNLSRLQLAIRSLESRRPTIRLAVLGLPAQRTARRLARLLLADPLADEGAWEQKLADGEAEKAILLRYGEDADSDAALSSSSNAVLNVPSRILQRHNLEILVSSLNISAEGLSLASNPEELRRAALIPTADGALSFAGGTSFLTYPVHRALIVAEDLQGCLTLGKYTTSPELDGQQNQPVNIKLASNFPALADRGDRASDNDETPVSIIDVARATKGIDALRESISNSSTYEQNWNASGLPKLEKWLALGLASEEDATSLNPAVRSMVVDLLDQLSGDIHAAETEARLQTPPSVNVADSTRQSFDDNLKVWAKNAHIELRDKLDAAFESSSWARLSWWKLPWRVDDVQMILSDLLQGRWLVEADKSIIWLSGCSTEAGLPINPDTSTLQPSDESSANTDALPVPWPTQIPEARKQIEAETIPPLQTQAQALLLQTISVTTLTTALSALLYISVPALSLYSAGAVAALGLTYSLRRLQRTWEAARNSWKAEIRERGRVTLKQVEENVRRRLAGLPQRGWDDDVDDAAVDRRTAMRAVEVVRVALDELDAGTSKEKQATRQK